MRKYLFCFVAIMMTAMLHSVASAEDIYISGNSFSEFVYENTDGELVSEEENNDIANNFYNTTYSFTSLNANGKEIIVSFPFEVSESGIYGIEALVGGDVGTAHLSIDGREYKTIFSSLAVSENEAVLYTDGEKTQKMSLTNYILPYTYNLSQGLHTVSLKIQSETQVCFKRIVLTESDSENILYINGADTANGTYPFNIEQDGYYSLDEIVFDNSGTYCAVAVDDTDGLNFSDTSSYMRKKEIDNCVKLYTNKVYYLKRGRHYLTAQNGILFDYVKIIPTVRDDIIIFGTDGFESVTDGTFKAEYGKGNKNVSDSSNNLCIYDNTSAVELNYTFHCDRDGYYNLSLVGSECFSYGIDGEKYNLGYISSSYYGEGRKIFKSKPTVYLTEGDHTFTLYVDNTASVNYFSYARFDYAYNVGSIVLNFSENNNYTLDANTSVANINYNNGSYHYTKITWTKTKNSVMYPFYVTENGNYTIKLVATGLTSFLSPTFSIDDTSYQLTEGDTYAYCQELKNYTYSQSINLEKGTHNIKFTAPTLVVGSSNISVDYILFEKNDNVGQVYIYTQGDDYVEVGETLQAEILSTFYAEEPYTSVAFESTDENVFTVNDDGIITAVGMGKADIKATVVLNNGETKILTKEIRTYMNDLYIDFSNIEIDGEEVNSLQNGGFHNINANFNGVNLSADDGETALILTVYENGNLKKVKVFTDENLSGCEDTGMNINISNVAIDNTTKIIVYAWNGLSDMQPLMHKKVYTQNN